VRTLFIKPSRPIVGDIKLDPVRVARNIASGVETSLALDTNILISIEKVVKNGNKWSSVKMQGLHNFVKLLEKCPSGSICISPGLALNEMPPELAQQALDAFEEFCSVHLPGFRDTPNCTRVKYNGKKENYGYLDLSLDGQATIALPFISILFLNLVDKKSSSKSFGKFKEYFDLIESKIDVLSATEIEIAKYCFAEPPADCRETIELRKQIRHNFLKTSDGKAPKNSDEVLAIAFNGACDIILLHSANLLDTNGLDGVEQDSWIATKDKKLVDFCNIFHHVNHDGEAGKYAARTEHPEHAKDPYWMQVDTEFKLRHFRRLAHHVDRETDIIGMVDVAKDAMREIEQAFDS